MFMLEYRAMHRLVNVSFLQVLKLMFSLPSEFWEEIIGGTTKETGADWRQPGHPFLFGPR